MLPDSQDSGQFTVVKTLKKQRTMQNMKTTQGKAAIMAKKNKTKKPEGNREQERAISCTFQGLGEERGPQGPSKYY